MNRAAKPGLMGLWIALFGAYIAVSVSVSQANPQKNPHADVLSIGGAVTEIVYALDQGHRLLARDTTSTWPKDALQLPNVGYMRALSPEGVLSVAPSMILSAEGAGPIEAIEAIRAANINFVEIPEGFSGDAIVEKIRVVGDALEQSEKADALAQRVRASLDSALAVTHANEGPKKRVLFVLSAQGGKLMVAGQNTGADALIQMAGGINAASGFQGYKPMTDEAATAAAPDAILMMDRGGDHGASAEVLFTLPALAVTPAAESQALIRMDGLKMLGFGPRTAEAVLDLNAALYGETSDGLGN